MRTITIGGVATPAIFTTWTVDEFYKLTKINLYDAKQITKVFKVYGEDTAMNPEDFDLIVKLAYCAAAAATMPEDAGDDWKPSFTVSSIKNKIPAYGYQKAYAELLSVYMDKDFDVLNEIIAEQPVEGKNDVALMTGQ